MFLRFLSDWRPFCGPLYRAGQVAEIHDRLGYDFVARGMAIEVTAADMRREERARMFGGLDMEQIKRDVLASLKNQPAATMPPSGGKRVITGAQWCREFGLKANADDVLQAVRELQISMAHASLNDGQRTIDLIAATGEPIRRKEYNFYDSSVYIYDEALDMSPGAVRLERLNKGAPLLDSHNYGGGTAAIVGAVVPGSARVGGGKLSARVKFSRSENGDRAFQDAKDGILRAVSIGYIVHEMQIDDTVSPPMRRDIDWEPHEISVVAIGADKNAGFRGMAEVPAGRRVITEDEYAHEIGRDQPGYLEAAQRANREANPTAYN